MAIFLGNKEVLEINNVSEIYLGDNLIFSSNNALIINASDEDDFAYNEDETN